MTTPTTQPTPRPGILSAIGGSVLSRTIQFVVGCGLAIFLLWWGLPKVAKTS